MFLKVREMARITNLFDFSVEILYRKVHHNLLSYFSKEITEWAHVYICLVLLFMYICTWGSVLPPCCAENGESWLKEMGPCYKWVTCQKGIHCWATIFWSDITRTAPLLVAYVEIHTTRRLAVCYWNLELKWQHVWSRNTGKSVLTLIQITLWSPTLEWCFLDQFIWLLWIPRDLLCYSYMLWDPPTLP